MGPIQEVVLRPILLSNAEAVLLGLLAGGCRLLFTSPAAVACAGDAVRRTARRLGRLGGQLIVVQTDRAAVLMAAGAVMSDRYAAAVVSDTHQAIGALRGLDDLPTVVVDISGRLPLDNSSVRLLLAPHAPQTAYDAGTSVYQQARLLRCPALLAGLESGQDEVTPTAPTSVRDGSIAPIHHDGPDDPQVLLVGGGPGFAACSAAQQQLTADGVEAAHLHLIQLAPFPGAIIAPAITSSRRVLIVEPGGPGTLAAYIRSHLGAPVTPFAELPRLAGAPLGPDEVAWRAREVMAL